MFKIYDDFLSENTIDEIEQELTSLSFPWYKSTSGYKTLDVDTKMKEKEKWRNTVDHSQLVHSFINTCGDANDSKWTPLVISLIQQCINHISTDWNISQVEILKSKSNIVLNNGLLRNKKSHSFPHIDFKKKHLVLLYYVNESDGDTIIFDQIKKNKRIASVSPKKGRLLVFDGDHYHASSSPQKSDCRIIINTNILNKLH